jgi:hypothetical protein
LRRGPRRRERLQLIAGIERDYCAALELNPVLVLRAQIGVGITAHHLGDGPRIERRLDHRRAPCRGRESPGNRPQAVNPGTRSRPPAKSDPPLPVIGDRTG